METIIALPEWFGAAVIGAIIASFGYIFKLFVTIWGESLAKYRSDKASLIELHSLLTAGKTTFKIQGKNRNKLSDLLRKRDPSLVDGLGFEESFLLAYPSMEEKELELHSIVRAYTIHTLFPLNVSVLDWLKQDKHFKSKKWLSQKGDLLNEMLAKLEIHLLLWVAKYKMWMPDNKSHTLVYLNDEEQHGVGFPKGIEDVIKEAIDKKHWLFG